MATLKPVPPNKRQFLSQPEFSPAGNLPPESPGRVSQEVFLHALYQERRRTERSGRPFLLLLISGGDLHAQSGGETAAKIHTALGSCVRETDIFGWYEEPTSIGLVITEIADTSRETVDGIVGKVSAALERTLSPEIYCRLALVVRLFPGDGQDRVFYPDLSHRNFAVKTDHIVKRAIDIVGSLLALLLLSPALLVIALLVKFTSPGPMLFCQKRIGRHGKEFCFYKFRTMTANNDPHVHREYIAKLIAGSPGAADTGGLYKLANDPRVTPLGRFLRRTSLDELPQFFNVLLNDMSLVGPRPPLPYEYDCYRAWHKRRVLELKPGITGLWQVEGRSRTTFDEMVRMDIRYSKRRNVWQDLKIIGQTPSAMFFGRGAC